MSDQVRTEGVSLVRTFASGSQLGVGRSGASYFVYTRENIKAAWSMHCGPYSTWVQGADWIQAIREDAPKNAKSSPAGYDAPDPRD